MIPRGLFRSRFALHLEPRKTGYSKVGPLFRGVGLVLVGGWERGAGVGIKQDSNTSELSNLPSNEKTLCAP